MEGGVDDAETSRFCELGTPGTPENKPPARLMDEPGPTTKLPPYRAPAPIANPSAIHGIDRRFPCRMHVDCTRFRKRLTVGIDLLFAELWCVP